MKKIILPLCISSLTLLLSCNDKDKTQQSNITKETKTENFSVSSVPYKEAKNYFVKNTYKSGDLANPKITSQEEFDKIFGMATTMGENGKPTSIDFTKEYAVAIIENASDKTTTLKINTIEKNNDKVVVNYSKNEGEKQTFSTQPFLLLIIDNQYKGNVELVKN